MNILSGLIWIQTVCHSDRIPERIFQKKVEFEKKLAYVKKTGDGELKTMKKNTFICCGCNWHFKG